MDDAKASRVFEKMCVLSKWFKAKGIEKPEEFHEVMAELVVAEDQTISEVEATHARKLAEKHGWVLKSDA